MSNKFKVASSIITYLLKHSTTKAADAWVQWRETVLAIYQGEVQSGVINAEINTGKNDAKRIDSIDDTNVLIKTIQDDEHVEAIALLGLFKIILENTANYIPGSFNSKLFDHIVNSITNKPEVRKTAFEKAGSWFKLKEENRFYTEVYVPASLKPILLDFLLRSLTLWFFQNWGWDLLPFEIFWIVQLFIIPIIIFSFAIFRDKNIIKSTQSFISQIKIENIRIRIKNTAWHYLLIFILLLSSSMINLLVVILEFDSMAVIITSLLYGSYLLILQTNFSKQLPTYLNIRQQIEDKEHRELSGELTPDQNDEEIVNLEVNLKAENERMNAYVIEAALFGALAFSGYLQVVSEGGLSLSSIADFNHHLLRVLGNYIDSPVKDISVSYSFLLSKSGILALLGYQLLLCSIFFLAVIASRLRFSKLTDYIDRFLQLSKAMNVKEETLILKDNADPKAINYYNNKIKDLLRKGYKKQDEILPIMEYMQFFRTLGVVMFFIIIITGGLFISVWISLILFFISTLSLFYFHLGNFRTRLKSFYINMQEFYYRVNATIHWVCWSMIIVALFLRTFAMPGGELIMVLGFLFLFLHYLLNLFIPVQFDYEIKNVDDAFGANLAFHKILAYLFKISLALFFLSYMLKTQSLDGANALMVISIPMMSVYFLLIPKYKKEGSLIEYLLGIAISITLLTILLKSMHWPGTDILKIITSVLIPVALIFTYFKRNIIRPVIIRTIIILSVVVAGSFSQYVMSAIRTLNFNYAAYEQHEKEMYTRSLLIMEDGEFINSRIIGSDSVQSMLEKFNKDVVNVDNPDYDFLNEVAWHVYLNSNDSILLKNALVWSEKTIKHEKDWVCLDTYAALLYKNKMFEEAKVYAEEAYELGNDDVTYKLIQDIDSVLSIQE